ncbi:MAG: putative baseplate assembly protein, partial [Anaerolineae bacterium]
MAQLTAEPAESPPAFRVLAYTPASSTHIGYLQVDAVLLGQGDGRPHQQRQLPQPPILAHSCRIYTFEETQWVAWEIKPDLVASSAADSHVIVDLTTGQVQFGDGQRGRVVPRGAPVVAQYDVTTAEAGNLPAGALTQLAATLENQLRPKFATVETAVAHLTNRLPAQGGTAAETIGQAMARYQLTPSPRAVTLADYERHAMATPGVQVARVEARANVHPAMPNAKSPGIITVIVLPELPQERPSPSLAMRQQIKRYLNGRRLIGTRVEVVGPTWTEIRIQAEVAAREGVDTAVLPQKVSDALAQYFHPLTGGTAGTGWPFGRDVYLTELYQVIDNVPGVDHVLSLGIMDGAGQLSCSNVCIDSFGLIFSGPHDI